MVEKMNYSKIDAVEVGGIDTADYPDFTDAFIEYAEYDGVEMTEEMLDVLTQDSEFVYEQVLKTIY
jgi:hypothetical protein